MSIERTVVLIKPDAVFARKVGKIKEYYRRAGLRIVRERKFTFTRALAARFYSAQRGKYFFPGLVLAMSSGPSIAMILEGEDAIRRCNALTGATDPRNAEAGTIRCDFLSAGGPFNTAHSSDTARSVWRETRLVFGS